MQAMKPGVWLAVCGSLFLVSSTCAAGDEKRIKPSEIPKAVMAGLKAHYPDATFLGFSRETEDGVTMYEAEMKVQDRRVDVSLDAAGTVKEEETRVGLSELPEAVRQGLAKSRFSAGKVRLAERHIEPGTDKDALFELHIVMKKKSYEIVFDDGGRLVENARTREAD